MQFVALMNRAGTIRRAPAAWSDAFVSELGNKGS